ncbi:MAG: protein kinase [Azospirillum sp.]|nr:protein kinase [Azospirillum sp.]
MDEAQSEPAPGLPGSSFRGLRVETVLAEGGMGVTLLASHPVLKVPFVVKLVKQTTATDVFREAHLAARVISRHVVPIVDAGLEGTVPFMIHGFVDGIDLMELVEVCRQQGRHLPTGIACAIIAGIASGLHAVHQAGVIHRDVKPGNIYLRGDGSAALGDFGLAVDRAAFAHSDESADWGTPNYKPPEQWTDGEITRQSDIYALGATAHAVLTGRPPFVTDSLDGLRDAHLSRPYGAPAAQSPREAYAFWVIARMLAKAPVERYDSAQTVAELFRFIATTALPLQWLSADVCRIGDLVIALRCGALAPQPGEAVVLPVAPDFSARSEAGAALTATAGLPPPDATLAATRRPPVLGDVLWQQAEHPHPYWLAQSVVVQGNAFCIQRGVLRGLFGADLRGAALVSFPPPDRDGALPEERAAQLMLEAFRSFAAFAPVHVRRIEIVLPTTRDHALWSAHLRYFTPDVLEHSLNGT